ncbi:MAG: hypothetical protein LJE91_13205 [Gammaproteobacteria bacterium]|jgi:2-methylisocitrate lyase-like PEP mutase family enzyme|nr:hypothetical protein [Gammaproteobacteria bacterium]
MPSTVTPGARFRTAIRDERPLQNVIVDMQTRQALYERLDYYRYEHRLDDGGEPGEGE